LGTESSPLGKGSQPILGLRVNLGQFALFSLLTLWIGWFLGMERVVVPLLGRDVFHISSFILLMSFIATFGFTKAILDVIGGRWSDKLGRRPVLIAGWLVGLPIPFILIYGADWSWVVLANVLMGLNQALTWTMTVTSKVDLVGQKNRGLALGINEAAGYLGQASGGVITGFLAVSFGLKPFPFYFGLAAVVLGLFFSLALARETGGFARHEAELQGGGDSKVGASRSFYHVFAETTWRNKTLFACSQAGLVEKFTDTLVWGLYPLLLVSLNFDLVTVALVAGLYQTVWGVSQLVTGALSDRVGRKPPIVAGMWIMAMGIALTATAKQVPYFYLASAVIGFGMALVYPVLLATVADAARPTERGTVLGVYRFWRDSGYGFGAVFLGLVADVFGIVSAFYFGALLLFASGLVTFVFQKETKPRL
jgi:MFS family permease